MKLSSVTDCPCCSGKAFNQCCGCFLLEQKVAKTPEQLMRSRFSAYYLGGFGNYLLATWFPATAKDLSAIELSAMATNWQRLEVLKKSQKADEGFVEFNAWFIDENEREQVLHEKSVFSRVAGHWLYVGGEADDCAA